MFIDIDYNKRKKGYKINLAKPNQQTIASISEAYGTNYSVKLGNINEVTFNVPYFIDKLDERVENENIELIKEKMYIKISYNNSDEWMVIDTIEDVGSGDERYMTVTTFTNVYETSNRNITELNLDVVNPEEYYDAVLNDVAWSIGTIDPLFKDIYRSVELSDVTVLEAIITGAETFGAVLDFDTENKKINLIDIDSRAKYRGLNINYSNFLQSINRKRSVDEMTTRLYVYGSEDLSIENVNPTGMRYLEDFTYFLYPFERDENKNVIQSSHYMSDELAHAILDKNELTEKYIPQIKEMQDKIDEETTEYINETTLLNELKFDEMSVSGLLDIAKATGDNDLILQRQNELAEIKTKVSIKELTVDHIDATIEDLERQISQLQSQISVTSFSKELYDELSMYIIESEFRDDRYIDENELYRDALKKFDESKSPSVVIEASIDNIIDSLEEDYYSDKIVLGDIARVTDKEMRVEMKSLITELSFDLDNDECDITIANGDIEKDGYDRILSVLYDTQSTTTMLENNKYKWDTVTDVKTEVDLMRDSEIDATRNRIKAGFRESVSIEDRGIILSNPDFPDEIVIMQAGVIALSTDGGENWSTSITPRGVMAETIIGKLVASNNLIVTNDSGSFRIDGDGLTVDMDSIKIMSGEGDTPENIVDSWNKMLITMDEFSDDGKLNEYEKNQIARQWNSIATAHSSMVESIQDAYGPETPENPYPAEYEIYMESYEKLRRYLNEEIQSDGHTILDPLNRSETTDIDSDKYNRLVSDYEVNKDMFQTVIPLELSQTFIEQNRREISLNYVKNGEIATKLNLSEEGVRIDGRLLEINSETQFNDDLVMNAGLIRSKDNAINIDLNTGEINLARPLTINSVPVATEEYVEESLADAIKNIDVEYGITSDKNTPPEVWNTESPSWENGKYIWSRTLIEYKNGNTEVTDPVNITGAQGSSGAEGKAGRSVKSIQEQYYLSTSPIDLENGSWVDNPPQWKEDKYIWTRSVITYENPSGVHRTEPISVSGQQGPKGDTGEQGPRGLQGLQGPEGKQGISGKDGRDSYTHIAYATGTEGQSFNHSTFEQATHIGMYVSNNQDSSTNWEDYEWTLIKGRDGKQGIQGPEGLGGITPFFHTAYANSADGTVDFSVDDSTDKEYIGQYTSYARTGKGRNLLPKFTNEKWNISNADIVEDYRIESNNSISASIILEVEPNTTYTMTFNTENCRYYFYDVVDGISGENIIFSSSSSNTSSTVDTFNTGENTQLYLSISFWSALRLENKSVWELKLEKGTEATEYSIAPEDAMQDSTNPEDYSWTKIKGEQGPQGIQGKDGEDGKPTYTWIRYADTVTGSGISNNPTGKEYIGLAHNKDTSVESNDPNDYTWSLIRGPKGEDGNRGVEGPKGKDGQTTYTWIKYSANANGSGLTDKPQANTAYIGIATNKTSPDESSTPSEYTWSLFKGPKGDAGEQGPRGVQGLQGPEGKQGIRGPKGLDGESQYTHIAYATSKTGSNFSHSTFDSATYIGMYVSNDIDSSETPGDYEWTLIKGKDGTQGIQGPKGTDGKTPYFHTAWANSANGVTGFSTTVSTNKLYIGTATSFESDDPTSPSAYNWTKIKGDKGDKGDQGPKGDTGPKGATGSQGPRGATGTSVESVTEYYLATSESSGIKSTDKRFTTAMQSMTATNKYLWNYEKINFSDGTSQPTIPVIIGVYGDKGQTGATGRSITSIQEYYVATSVSKDVKRPNTDGTNGWTTTMQPTTETNKYLWNYEKITWSSAPLTTYVEPIIIGVHGAKGPQGPKGATGSQGPKGAQGPQGIQGPKGDNGQSQYTHIRYSANANGSSMTTSPGSTTKYIGIAVTNSATAPGYGSFTWSKYVGDNGARGPQGPQGTQGVRGPAGANGQPTYTWVKYADTPTSGMNDYPDGKKYIGLAFNKTTATESTSYSAYQWSLMPQNIEIGGRNLLLGSGEQVTNGTYNIARYDLTDDIKENEEVTLTIWGELASKKTNFRVYNSGGSVSIASLTDNGDGTYSNTFKWKIGSSTNTYLNVYAFTNAQTGTSTIDRIKLERGNIATDWTEAPEDTQARVDERADEIDEKIGELVTIEDNNEALGEITTKLNDYLALVDQTRDSIFGVVDEDGNPIQEGVTAEVEKLLDRAVSIEREMGILRDTWNFEVTQITMAEEGLFVGTKDSNMGILIAPDRKVDGKEIPAGIYFQDAGETIAFISGQMMQINRGIFVDSAQIGEHQIETISGGHTIFRWIPK